MNRYIKYRNRRLYDKQHSTYVSLKEFFDDVREGHEVVVIHHASKADITRETMLEALLSQELKEPRLDIAAIIGLIRQ